MSVKSKWEPWKRLLEECKVLVLCESECRSCNGTGIDEYDRTGACLVCGGFGILCDINMEVGILKELIQEVEKTPQE